MRRASSLAAGFGDVPTGDFEGLYGVLEHRPHLLHRDAREPRDEAWVPLGLSGVRGFLVRY